MRRGNEGIRSAVTAKSLNSFPKRRAASSGKRSSSPLIETRLQQHPHRLSVASRNRYESLETANFIILRSIRQRRRPPCSRRCHIIANAAAFDDNELAASVCHAIREHNADNVARRKHAVRLGSARSSETYWHTINRRPTSKYRLNCHACNICRARRNRGRRDSFIPLK